MSIDIVSISIEAKSTGIDQAATSLNNLAAASDKAEQAVSKVGVSNKTSSDTASTAASAIDKLLVKYQAQADLLGATTSVSNAYNAALKGGSEAHQAAAAFLGAEVDAYKALSQAQSEGIAANKALDASYNSLAKQADAYYASQAKIAAAAQSLNDAGYRAQEYKKLQDAIVALKNETDALAAAEAREKATQQNRDIEMHTQQVRAYSAAQAEAIRINNDLAAAEQRHAKASQEAFNAIGPTRATLDQANKSGQDFVKSLELQAGAAGLSGKALRDYNAEVLRTKAAQLGVTDQSKDFIQKLQDTEKASGHAASGVSGIFRELLVLGHEASQGQFTRLGGSMIVLAERADVAGKSVAFVTEKAASLGTTIATVLAPIAAIVAALAAAGLVVYNFYKAAENYHELTNALILTNNYAGASAESLLAMARAATVAGGSLASAKTTVLELAESGKFTADQIGFITAAAIALERSAGVSTKDTIKHFEDLATQSTNSSNRSTDAIAKDAMKLNDQYHYLTAGIYEQIVAFEKEGDAQTAISISLEAYANNVEKQAKKIEDSLSGMMKYFHVIRDAASAMWDAISQKDSDARTKAALELNLKQFNAPDGGSSHVSADAAVTYRKTIAAQIAEIDGRLNAQLLANQKESDAQRLEQEKIHGQARLNTLMDQYDKTNKATKDLAQFDMAWSKQSEDYKLAHFDEYTKARANIEEKTHDKIKKIRAEGTSAINAELQAIVASSEEQKKTLQNDVSALDAAYKAKKLSVFDYVDQKSEKLKAEETLTTETYAKEVTAILLSTTMHKYSVSELNILAGKRSELYKKWQDDLAKNGQAVVANSELITSIASKTADAQAQADTKVIESLQANLNKIQDKVDAYNRLPEAVRAAGVTEKQIQDEITQSNINRMQAELEQTINNNNVEDALIKARIELLKQKINLENNTKTAQITLEGQQQESKFNLGFAARAKEESAMAVASFNDAGKTIAEGFQSIFGDASKPMQNFFKAFTDGLAKQTAAQERYNKVKEAYKDAPEATKILKLKEADVKLTAEQTQANLGMYADVAGAAQGFFDKQSTGYKVMGGISAAFHAAEVAMAIASIVPKMAAGAASMFATLGPFGFAAVAGMVAVMAGFGFAGGGSSTAPPTSAVRQASNGTGSVLGDSDAKSESIQKALDTIAKDSGLGLVHFSSMDKSLQTLVTGISGLSSLLVRGTNLTSKVAADTVGSAQQIFSSKVLPFSIGESLTGGLLGKLVGNIFGGAKSVEDVGLKIGSGTVGNLANGGANVSQYTDTKTKGGWFSSDKYNTDIKSLGTEINNQFSLVIKSLADSIGAAADSLGLGGDEFKKHLSTFVVDIAEISTKGLTGDKIQEALQAAFSKLGDDMAKFAIVGLDQFQKVGEGYLETVARVANDLVQVQDVFAVLGKNMNVTGLAAVQVSEDFIKVFGSIDKLTSATQYYVDNFQTDAEKVAAVQKSLNTELTRLGISTGLTVEQFKMIVASQDLTTSSGQQMYAAMMNLAPAFKQVTDATEAATKAQADLLNKRLDMQLTIAQLTGDTAAQTAIIAQQRAIEIAGLDASLQPLQKRINLLNDEAAVTKVLDDKVTAAKSVATSDFNVLKNSIDVAKANAKAAYDAQVAITNAQISSLQTVNTAISSLSSALDSAIGSAVEALGGMSRVSAQTLLDQALNTAKSTGKLPTADSMKDVFASLAKDSTSSFSTAFDYKKDAGITAGKLADLNKITKDQKSVNDLQLEALQASLVTQKAAYDAQVAGYDQALVYAQLQLDAMNNNVLAVKDLASALMSFTISSNHAIALGQTNGTSVTSSATGSQISAIYQALLGRAPDAGGFAFYSGTGESASSVYNSILHSTEYAGLHPNGSHANGLDSVPFDGYTAKLHKGEMVLPAKQAKGVAQGDDMKAVVQAINNLKDDNSSENQAMASALIFLKKLFQNVSPNGQTLQVTQTVIS